MVGPTRWIASSLDFGQTNPDEWSGVQDESNCLSGSWAAWAWAWTKYSLLVLVADVVPVIPSTMCDDVIEVGVGEDDPWVLAHGSAHVEWARPRHPTVQESETRLLLWRLSILRRYRTELGRDRVNLALLRYNKCQVPTLKRPKYPLCKFFHFYLFVPLPPLLITKSTFQSSKFKKVFCPTTNTTKKL